MPGTRAARRLTLLGLAVLMLSVPAGCSFRRVAAVPRQHRWGSIYSLDISTGRVELIHSDRKHISGITFHP
jgi:hypothetical protein